MPTPHFWQAIPEFRTLAAIAARDEVTFALRGSAAEVLTKSYARNKTVESLLEAIPPLSDIDFVVDHKADAYVLAAAFAREIPASRFFRVDIRTEGELKHYQDAPLMITGQPRVRFGGARRSPNEVVLTFHEGKLRFDVGDGLMSEPVILLSEREPEPQECLANLIWLGRRCPDGSKACADYSGKLAASNPRRIAEQLHGKPLRKLLFDLVKLLLQLVASKEPKPDWLDDEFLGRVAEEKEHAQLRRVVQLLRDPPAAVVTVVVPRLRRNRWVSEVEAIEPLSGSADELELHLDAAPKEETAFVIGRRLPPARVVTDDPERPGCCRYRDFSRGVVEIAWTGPVAPQAERLTLVSVDEEFFFAPSASTTRGEQHAVKVDYGFLCQMRGARGPVDVHYAGVHDAE